MVEKAYIGLGSNVGDRQATISRALELLGKVPGVRLARVSDLVNTKPVGPIAQPDFLNGVAEIETSLEPRALLEVLLGIEQQLGRVRRERWGPRTIDLDILIFGDRTIDEEGLKVPHPELQNRPFLLDGLRELSLSR